MKLTIEKRTTWAAGEGFHVVNEAGETVGWFGSQEKAEAYLAELTPAPRPKATPYDPGKPTAARQIGPSLWAIDSFRGEGASYVVDLANRTCNCPSFQHRGPSPCKHILSCAQQATFCDYLDRARTVSDRMLDTLIGKYADDEILSGALRVARAERQAPARSLAPILARAASYGRDLADQRRKAIWA